MITIDRERQQDRLFLIFNTARYDLRRQQVAIVDEICKVPIGALVTNGARFMIAEEPMDLMEIEYFSGQVKGRTSLDFSFTVPCAKIFD